MDLLRADLLSKGYKDMSTSSVDSHHLASLNDKKNEKFRAAFGISQEYIGGSSFDIVHQTMKAAEREAKRQEKEVEKERLAKEKEKNVK